MKKFNIGDRVVMTPAGINRWGNQSGGKVGVVTGHMSSKQTWVNWGDGNTKWYNDPEIKLVEPIKTYREDV